MKRAISHGEKGGKGKERTAMMLNRFTCVELRKDKEKILYLSFSLTPFFPPSSVSTYTHSHIPPLACMSKGIWMSPLLLWVNLILPFCNVYFFSFSFSSQQGAAEKKGEKRKDQVGSRRMGIIFFHTPLLFATFCYFPRSARERGRTEKKYGSKRAAFY